MAFLVCAGVGYLGASVFVAPARQETSTTQRATGPAVEELGPMPAGQSAFIAEWENFRGGGSANSADLAERFLAAKDLSDDFRRLAFRAALVGEWTATDPAAALAFLHDKDYGSAIQLVREWLKRDADAAIAAFLAQGPWGLNMLKDVLSEIATTAPARLAEVVSALQKPDGRWDMSVQDAFARLGARDLEAARLAAEKVSGPWRAQALAGVAKVWAEKDHDAALTWAQALPAGAERDETLRAALIGWANTDPLAALERIDLAPPGGDGQMGSSSDTAALVLRAAGQRDWEKTLRWLEDHPGRVGPDTLGGLVPALSKQLTHDPAATLARLAQSGVDLQTALSSSLLNEGYVARDAIWAWLEQAPPGDFMRSVRDSLLSAAGYHDPMKAMELLERLPDTKENQETLLRGAVSLLSGGGDIRWFDVLLGKASPKVRRSLYDLALSSGYGMLADQPALWSSRIGELPEDRRFGAMIGLARSWGHNDPQAAMQWASTFPKPEQRAQVVGSVVDSWARQDVHAAARGIDAMPAGPNRDQAAQSLVTRLAELQPDVAWDWATSIATRENRMGAMIVAYTALQKRDANLAEQMLLRTNLSDQEREVVRKTRSP